ncbi:MAG: signal peptidase I [Candidatus Nealsonbacteria bacterium RBG_13_42_11]|uniref:Signal peptidase I n=1 Tax=Candidatus Nealsonbacteria bacterium RBG_13_42_11 TaxID=1801663 RepID=A0A1G2DYR3_9BACT|nr:MAG: signal peptidase I [Candidatus Nealsonbacteria bacterium RBG_13_42_11]
MKNFFSFVWEIVKIVVIALVIVIPIRYFLFQPFFVKGQSMEPNFENGDYLLIDEISYRLREPQRGEVIVFKYPNDTSQRYIKRIIGLPGETVEINNGQITVYSAEGNKFLDESGYLSQSEYTSGNLKMTLSEDEYFVLGDNRLASADSRRWGSLPEKDIIGRVFFRAFPFATLSCIEAPNY